jgi:hypothetical protein
MKLMRNLKGASLLVAVLIAVVASAFTVPTKHHAFTGTTYFGNESSSVKFTSGQSGLTVTIPSGYSVITGDVNSAGGPAAFAEAFCVSPTTVTCFVGGILKNASPVRIKINIATQGTLDL